MKQNIKSTARFIGVDNGMIMLKYDSHIIKWFKQFNQEDDEIIYMNYEALAKEMSKLIGAEVDDYMDYPYWDEHYTHYMSFNVDGISDAKVKKALKGKVFTIKLKAERY